MTDLLSRLLAERDFPAAELRLLESQHFGARKLNVSGFELEVDEVATRSVEEIDIGGVTLLRADGLILFDNALWDGSVADVSNQEPDTIAIRALNRLVATDPRVDAYLAVCGDGLHLARKK